MYASTDAEMLSKTVESIPKTDQFTSLMQPSGHSEFDGHSMDTGRFSSIQPSSQRRTSVAPLHLVGPSSGNGRAFSTYSSIPCKAQRLMGVGVEMLVFQKSSFVDSDDEEIAAVPVKGWAGITNRSKSEPRALFLSGVRRMSRSESQTGITPAKSRSIDEGTPQSHEGALHLDATSSRWSGLGNRLRNSSVAPTKLRLRKCTSPTPPAPVPSSKRSSEPSIQLITTAAQAASPVRVSSRQSTPKRASFPSDFDRMSLSDDRRSSSHRVSYTGWDDARASSQALKQSIEPAARSNVHYEKLAEYKMRRAQMIQPPLTSRRDSVALSHAPPMSNAVSSLPLSFDVNRRPRAPFPPSTDCFVSSSSALLDGQCQPQLPQGELPPGPSRMLVPSQKMRPMPVMPDKANRHLPSRPPRNSESGCDIFSEAANSFAARVPITVVMKESPSKQRQAKAVPPRRQPPPTGPVPPLPTVSTSKGLQSTRGVLVAEAWARDVDTHRMSLLERRAKTAEEKKAQADAALLKKRLSEVACTFAKDAMTETFTASLPINTCQGLCQQTQIDLVVGGVLFQTCFAEICKTEGVATSGLVAWLKKWACVSARSPSSKPNMHTALVHSASGQRNSGQGTKGTSSYPSSFDSEEDDEKDIEEDEEQEEDFEELHSANSLEYEMSTLQRLRCRSTEHALEKCIESISQHVKVPQLQPAHLTAAMPQRSPSHAHTPTSVSIDLEGGEGSEEGEDVSSGLSSTPDLIHTHAFVFTKTCSSSPPSSSWVPTDDDGSNGRKKVRPSNGFLEVHLERNPQLYSTVLHLLKHETLPLYYTSDSFPSMDRRRGLLAVQRECSWLGYPALVQICEDALTSL